MAITEEQVKHVANLSKLAFDEKELPEFRSTFENIIDMVETLGEVDTAGVPFTMSVADNLNRVREDEALEPISREEILKEVPESENGFIKVPAMLEGGGDA